MKTNRKISSRTALALLFSISAFMATAQTTESETGSARNSSFGIKGGANLSNFFVDEVHDENAKLGFNLGIYAKTGFSEYFAIQPELIYSQKGTRLEYSGTFIPDGKVSINMHYVELPVLAVFNFSKFNIHAGPYISYLAGVTVKNKSDDGSVNFEDEIDKDNFESIDYGLAGGIGLDGNGVGFGLRYNYGLKEIGKEREFFGQPYRFPNAKNSVLQAYLTIGF